MNDKIHILIATYNGEKYLSQQLDSIFAQSINNWHILVRDDCSTDNTVEIIEQYAQRYPGKSTLLENDGQNVGASQNFAKLLQHSTADYIMFSDQDDIWLPRKIEVTLAKMTELEGHYGKEKPLLVHTDLKVVDDNLEVIADSLWDYQLSDPKRGRELGKVLLQNVATGCSVMINRPLRNQALPIPNEAMMHDWWLVLVAAAFGYVDYFAEPTALYRQHGASEIGARKWDLKALKTLMNYERRKTKFEIDMQRIRRQAGAFLKRYEPVLTISQKDIMDAFLRLHELNFFKKRYYTIRYGFFYTGLIRNIGRMLTM